MRRFTVRRSPVHGNGVFALCPLHAGEMLVEYKGKIVDWSQAVRAHRRAGREGHTAYSGERDHAFRRIVIMDSE